MKIAPFSIEHFFMAHEFSAPYLLCASDCESMTVGDLLQLAGREAPFADPAAALHDLHLGYTETPGHPRLRAAIAAGYQAVDPASVVVLSAPEEGIYIAMRSLLEPGDEVVVLTPAYDSLREVAGHIVGPGNLREWPLRATADGWALDLDALPGLLTARTKLLIVNFPHNPTGFLPTPEEQQALLALASQRGLWLFSDEMYRGLERDEGDRLPSAADLYHRCVTLSGLSKVHGLPGLRVGWLIVGDAALRGEILNWKMYTTICSPAPSELLAELALSVQPQLVARSRAIIGANLEAADAFFDRWRHHFIWRAPRAGSVALVELRGESATDHCRAALSANGVLLLPSPYFSYGDRHLRLGLGRRNFVDNLEHYDAFLRAAAPRGKGHESEDGSA